MNGMSMKDNYNLKKLKKRPSKLQVDEGAHRISISLKVLANDLAAVKNEAQRQGLPYQTLLNSIIHRYITGEFIAKRELALLNLAYC